MLSKKQLEQLISDYKKQHEKVLNKSIDSLDESEKCLNHTLEFMKDIQVKLLIEIYETYYINQHITEKQKITRKINKLQKIYDNLDSNDIKQIDISNQIIELQQKLT